MKKIDGLRKNQIKALLIHDSMYSPFLFQRIRSVTNKQRGSELGKKIKMSY